MTNIKREEPIHRVNLSIRASIHSDLVLRAREERRSTTNLINLILEQWAEGYRREVEK